MKENENQEPSSMAGAAKGGNTSKEIVGSAVSAAAGEPVAKSVLTIERIVQLADESTDRDFGLILEPFARSIEREVAARLAAPTQVSAPQAELEAPNFCDRCGKRLFPGSIHTCTPPDDIATSSTSGAPAASQEGAEK